MIAGGVDHIVPELPGESVEDLAAAVVAEVAHRLAALPDQVMAL